MSASKRYKNEKAEVIEIKDSDDNEYEFSVYPAIVARSYAQNFEYADDKLPDDVLRIFIRLLDTNEAWIALALKYMAITTMITENKDYKKYYEPIVLCAFPLLNRIYDNELNNKSKMKRYTYIFYGIVQGLYLRIIELNEDEKLERILRDISMKMANRIVKIKENISEVDQIQHINILDIETIDEFIEKYPIRDEEFIGDLLDGEAIDDIFIASLLVLVLRANIVISSEQAKEYFSVNDTTFDPYNTYGVSTQTSTVAMWPLQQTY